MIEGNLVRLRFPEPGDHLQLVKWRNENLQYFFSDEPVSLENHLDWYERVRRDSSQRFFVIEVTEHDREKNVRFSEAHPSGLYVSGKSYRPIGTIGLQNIDFRHRRAEYGRFLIAEEYRGKGYGRDAFVTLLKFAFTTLGLHKIYGEVLASNVPAAHLCYQIGFEQEGMFRAHIYKQGEFQDVMRFAVSASAFGSFDRSVPIERLGLSTRTYNSLRRAGIKNVREVLGVLAKGDRAVLAIHNVGKVTLSELKTQLWELGFLEHGHRLPCNKLDAGL